LVNKKIIDWIKSEEAAGYNEKQLRESLLQAGYEYLEVDDAIRLSRESNLKPSFEQSFSSLFEYVSSKGKLFKFLFYFFTGLFSFSILSGIATSVASLNIIGLIPLVIIAFYTYNYVKKKKMYSLLMLVFTFFPGMFLFFMIYPLIQGFIGGSNTTFYIIISVHALILGFIFSFMFGRVVESFKEYLKSAIVFSSILAVVFALNNLIYTIYLTFIPKIPEITKGFEGLNPFNFISHFSSKIVNPYISFALAFVFLNIPYIIYFFKIQHKKPLRFLLYLIPIVIFIVLSFIFGYFANMMLNSFLSSIL